MATDMYPEQSGGGGPDGGSDERWQRIWSHREHLLKVARRRSMSVEDAEDAVHEAMIRAVENPYVDHERLGAWLTTVTMRLCVDRYRQVYREAEARSWPKLTPPCPVPVDEAVCDRAEAKWLARRSGELPSRQAEALWLKSEDLDVDQVARKMGLSYRTVESLLARARRTLRKSLAGTLVVAGLLCWRGRPRAGSTAQAMTVASTAATLAILGLALPYAHEWDSADPPRSYNSETAKPPESGRGQEIPPANGTRAEPDTGGPVPTSPVSLPAGMLPALPETVSLPTLPTLSAPSVSSVPAVSFSAKVPQVPPVPSIASVPRSSRMKTVSKTEVPVIPGDAPTGSTASTGPTGPTGPSDTSRDLLPDSTRLP
ncbi:sigma-70 family RNA polymerase sigma factor [Streptomyces sp. NPDC004647]|uniref:sigma-70 family RNA polymerase sigma factor n=1 Tax=Streptomyces sp. NPDC004647 TaxID=3154671 RepID=UPI0033A3F9DB